MTIRSPRRARVADDDERDAGITERLDVLGVASLAVFLVVSFFGADFFAVASFVGVLLALALAFFFAGMTPPELDGSAQTTPLIGWTASVKNYLDASGAPESDAPAASGHARAVQQRPA
jgi:hypothetical protein